MLAIFNIGPLEWIVLLVGAVLLFGGDLPSVVRRLAQFLGKLRAMAAEITREVDLHDRYASPPQRPQLPPPPVDFGVDPGASRAEGEEADEAGEPLGGDDDRANTEPEPDTQPGASSAADEAPRDTNSDPGSEASSGASSEAPRRSEPEGAAGDPPDHSDWEDETGSDRPRDLSGD